MIINAIPSFRELGRNYYPGGKEKYPKRNVPT
jgi:hypothetical protein